MPPSLLRPDLLECLRRGSSDIGVLVLCRLLQRWNSLFGCRANSPECLSRHDSKVRIVSGWTFKLGGAPRESLQGRYETWYSSLGFRSDSLEGGTSKVAYVQVPVRKCCSKCRHHALGGPVQNLGQVTIVPRNNGVKGEMNLKRLATILGGTLCLIAMLGPPYLYVRVWHHPLAKVLGVYHHKVSTWEELCEVLSGKDIYEKYSARVLSYKCEDIRNSVAETLHRARVEDTAAFLHTAPDARVVRELERLKMTGAWRNENTLHLSYETADDYQFKQITKEFTKLVTKSPESNVPEERCIPLSVQGLFEEVILHGPHGTIRLETANRESPCSVGGS